MREAQAAQRRQQDFEAARKAKVQRARECVTNIMAAPEQSVTNTKPSVTNTVTNKARVVRWRNQNPERYRTYQRNLMRKRRAEARGAK
jgi:hypothetical protein